LAAAYVWPLIVLLIWEIENWRWITATLQIRNVTGRVPEIKDRQCSVNECDTLPIWAGPMMSLLITRTE